MKRAPKACRRARKAALAASARPDERFAGHLTECPECRKFSNRLEAVQRTLEVGAPVIAPGPDFAGRVVERLPGPSELLGWAALRLLPAAIALVLVLSWLNLTAVDSRELLFEPVDEAILMTFPGEAPR